jgi:HTH-type transcriptional regulator/antitoxin HigA
MMNINPIHNDEDLEIALARLDKLWGAAIGTPEGNELEILAALIEKYEDEHYPIPPTTPINPPAAPHS